jgi:peptidoglycan/LPS O-acetylase OafA/YrhL
MSLVMQKPPSSAAPRLLLLDSLRGMSALVVLFHHVCTLFPASFARLAQSSEGLHALAAFVSRRNTEAVLLFFVLSGFSIRLSVEADPLAEGGAVQRYLHRRARRILPPYLLALALSGLLAHTLAPVPAAAVSLTTLVGNLLFLQTANGVPGQWFLPYAGNAPLWSLSFEVFFYLSYPLLVLGVSDPRRRLIGVALAAAGGLLACALVPNPLAMFCGAGLIWYFGVELAQLHLAGRAALPLRAFCGLFVALGVLRASAYGLEVHGLWVGCGWLLLGSLAIRHAPRLQRLRARLRAPLFEPLAKVGAISYPLYLLHVPILRACAATLGDRALSLMLGVASSAAVAVLVERSLSPASLRGWFGAPRPLKSA